MLSSHIFRAYDIRGIVDKDFDEIGTKKIGSAYATFLKNKNPETNKLAVGRDGRNHSEKLQKAFIEGVLECGINVCNIGLSTSPLLNFAICDGNFDGGVNITASHNPKEFNGFKLQRKDAHAIFGKDIQVIRDIAEKENFTYSNDKGKIFKEDFSERWLNKLSSLVNIEGNPKIAVDCGNGVTGKFVEKFFEKLKCKIIPLYTDVDGNFPNHEANPEEEENLEDLKKVVIKNNTNLGIAFDGDGDRIGVIDEKGNHYSADLLLLILSRDVLLRNPGTPIVYDLKATQVLAEEIKKLGGTPLLCKTGHSFVEGMMQETGSLLGGEVSGHIFFAENYYGFDDAFLAAAKIIEIIQKEQKPLKDHFENLPKTFVTPEIKVGISEDKKFEIVEKIVKFFKDKYGDNVLTIDGARIDFGEGAWGIIRASNTSPYLTTRFEARTPKKLNKIQKEIFDHLSNYREITNIPKLFSLSN